ncbi:MAG: hypothetical protein M4579_002594 [Chaenotheca gracillima]|nr:MAG: hypothetical protein M4579_002594 [Chaenotheca gracillima]
MNEASFHHRSHHHDLRRDPDQPPSLDRPPIGVHDSNPLPPTRADDHETSSNPPLRPSLAPIVDASSSSPSSASAVDSSVRRKPLPRDSQVVVRTPSGETDIRSLNALSKHLRWPSLSHQQAAIAAASAAAAAPSKGQSVNGVSPSFKPSSPLVLRDLDRFPHGQSPLTPTSHSGHVRIVSESVISRKPSKLKDPPNELRRAVTMSLHPAPRQPQLSLKLDSQNVGDSMETAAKPRSPGSKLGSLFGWKTSSPGAASSATTFTDQNSSPLSAKSSSPESSSPPSRSMPLAIDVPKANAAAMSVSFSDSALSIPPQTPAVNVKVDEMETELREISSELASSIRREMDLEDLVERLQAEAANPQAPSKRTSDYFSDSGTSSVRYPLGDAETRELELEKMQRKTEQEKAQLRVDLSQKVQDERTRRKSLESHIRALEEKVTQVDHQQLASKDASGRVKELEASLEDFRRRLTEERQVKENFEDLLSAMKGEIESHRNERDNLRDEIVPQLRARVEGLEADAAEHQKLTYENSRMQQELQSLKNENTTLMNARRLQLEMQSQSNRINSIAEEDGVSPGGLSRSNSLARGSMMGLARRGSLTRSGSVKERESRDSLAERVKDIEAQRDALHQALKNLLERQDFQNRENSKRIRALETERDRALAGPSKRGYNGEVSQLRDEINLLRRRADDALEQKWQCEKGLGGLKMDLDRAEQETSSLRSLLQEHDISVPKVAGDATSASLEKAYKELQSSRAMAQKQADEGDNDSLAEEMSLASQLQASASHVEGLAFQVQQQLASNDLLRKRLAAAVGRGEANQKSSAERINEMQGKLKALEDKVMEAQQHSEDTVAHHEQEVREMRESHTQQLLRVKTDGRSPARFSPNSPLSPLFATRSPKLDLASSGLIKSISEESKSAFLEKRVGELEKALSDADKEMQEVVSRMNLAQIEVMDLQSERDEAMRRTRRLQTEIGQEQQKMTAFRF